MAERYETVPNLMPGEFAQEIVAQSNATGLRVEIVMEGARRHGF